MSKRILIAQDAHALKMTREGLEGYNVAVAKTTEQGLKLIAKKTQIDLFLLGIHFDESRAIELVHAIRMDSRYKGTPVILVRLLPTKLGESLRVTAAALIKLGTISNYLELEGDHEASQKIKAAIDGLLNTAIV